MKVQATLFTTVLFSWYAYGQNITIEKGPVIDPAKIMSDIGLSKRALASGLSKGGGFSNTLLFNPKQRITYAGSGINKGNFYFAALDNYLDYASIKALTAESISQEVFLHTLKLINDKVYVVYSQEYKDQDAFTTYVNEVNDDMEVLGSPIKLCHFNNLKDEGFRILTSRSKNEKYESIIRIHKGKRNAPIKITAKVVDEQFSEVWNKTFQTKGVKNKTKIRSVQIDNAGNLFVLLDDLSGKTSQTRLYGYFPMEQTLKIFTPGPIMGENYGSKLEIIDGETPTVVGLSKEGKLMSYFIHRVNTSTQQLEYVLESDMPTDFYKTSKFKVFESKDWRVESIISPDNENIVASIEATLVDDKYHLHHTYNTFIISVNAYGNENWTRTIYKKQSLIQGTEGHLLIPAGKKTLVIYNDHEKNLTLSPEDSDVEGFRSKDARAVVQEIDENGNVKKYPFFEDDELNSYMLMFNQSSKIEKGLYYGTGMFIKGIANVTSRNFTFQINE